MIFYCPSCWNEVCARSTLCLKCGEELSSWERKEYVVKLIHALSHPEPETQRRAVFLLGEKKVPEAAAALSDLFRRTTKNPFLAGEIVETLGKIAGPAAFLVICAALSHPAFTVRGAAAKALQNFPGEDAEAFLRRVTVDDPSAYVRETAAIALPACKASGRKSAHG